MTNLNIGVEVSASQLAEEIATYWETDDIRKFIAEICNQCQMLEVDQAILADMFRSVDRFYGSKETASYEDDLNIQELLEQYPPLDE